ncbi:hypothetical protein [Cohnella sp.]|uniref:hypothetical protein n=1 Tax=Cohnella sp. TaxID=1883426 RepID=UPI003569BAE0
MGLTMETGKYYFKADQARIEVRSDFFTFNTHDRWIGFRLCHGQFPFDERLSFSSGAGSFRVGGMDLIGAYGHKFALTSERGEKWKLWYAKLFIPNKQEPDNPMFRLVFEEEGLSGSVCVDYVFYEDMPYFDIAIQAIGFAGNDYYTLPLEGNFIFSESIALSQQEAAYYTKANDAGLSVRTSANASVTVQQDVESAVMTLKLPVNETAIVRFTVLGQGEWPLTVAEQPFDSKETTERIASVAWAAMDVSSLPNFERTTMQENGWKPDIGRTRERVAGMYVTIPGWHHPQSWDSGGHLSHVEEVYLDKVISSGAFDAIGFSRDGIYENGLQQRWLNLVRRTHKAGLRVYLKPGDGEITALRGDPRKLQQWASANFDVPADAQADVVRLCWESVLAPWETANLCLRQSSLQLEGLSHKPWQTVSEQIADFMTDRFSLIIDEIHRYAPNTTIDIECGDTNVFQRLLNRHDNLRVMYMFYGDYPRVSDFVDLYYSVAKEVLGAGGIVLETDCYYTDRYPSIESLRMQDGSLIYDADDIDRIVRKHEYILRKPVEACWAWGINMNASEQKFAKICETYRKFDPNHTLSNFSGKRG